MKVGAVGICGSDLHILKVPPKHPAKAGVILGHETAGRVAAVGKGVRGFEPGDRVAVDCNPPCGHCAMCREGFPNACLTVFDNPDAPGPGWPRTLGQWWDGAMAEYVKVPSRYVYHLSDSIPLWQAAALEPIACVINGIRKARFEPGQKAVVLGAGPIGLMFAGLFKAMGAGKVIVSEPAPIRARAARECRADIVVDPTKEDLKGVVMRETGDRGADVVVDAVGWLLPECLEVVRFAGKVLLFGVDSSALPPIPQVSITTREIQVLGVYLIKFTMPAAMRVLEAGLLPMEKIVTHRLPLSEAAKGREIADSGQGIKVILEPNQLD